MRTSDSGVMSRVRKTVDVVSIVFVGFVLGFFMSVVGGWGD